MIDIHPPQHGSITRRDFFVHLGIVVLGILIAIGLEQAVELLHQRHQAAELRENLHAESQQILSDTSRCIAATDYHVTWLHNRLAQLKQAVWQHKPLADPAPFIHPYCAAPDDPIWRTAKESGLAFHLRPGEVTGYSEIDYVITLQLDQLKKFPAADRNVGQLLAAFPSLPNGQPDLSQASPEDLRRYLVLLASTSSDASHYLNALHDLRGAAREVIAGETHLNSIYQAEAADQAADPLARVSTHL